MTNHHAVVNLKQTRKQWEQFSNVIFLQDNFMLDMYLAPHVNTLYSQIRNRALVQVCSIYVFIVSPSSGIWPFGSMPIGNSQISGFYGIIVRAVVFLPISKQARVWRYEPAEYVADVPKCKTREYKNSLRVSMELNKQRVYVCENDTEIAWAHSRRVSPQHFQALANFHGCLYKSKMFYICVRNHGVSPVSMVDKWFITRLYD